jgi:hypothetical protein
MRIQDIINVELLLNYAQTWWPTKLPVLFKKKKKKKKFPGCANPKCDSEFEMRKNHCG